MGPEYWKPGSPTALKKCSERVSNSCTDETDGCCAVIPCAYCIEWNPETGATVYATADFATNSWSATIAGAAWLGFWERNAESGECEFVVTLDAAEIYRKSCYEGQSCRDSSDSATATIDYVDGVITWTKFLSRPLEYVQDEETNCTVHFCDECECSAECLCVTITEPDTTVTTGEICDTAYDCDPPLWEGTVGTFDLSIALGRDEYGRCIITATVDGIEQDPVLFPGCGDASATITLADETTIEVTAKKCDCAQTDACPCCPGWPQSASGSIAWTVEAAPSDCSGGGEINPTANFGCEFTGDESGTLVMQAEGNLYVRVFCDADTGAWRVQYRSPVSGGGFEIPASATWADATEVTFVCPDCADAVAGQATGTIDFVAVSACETSGGVVNYDVLCHGEVTIGCP